MAKDKSAELKEPEIPTKSEDKQKPTPTKKQVQKKFSKFEKKGK